jgi:phosphopantothenoylcysteine decarboxylase/phosphopantothenate--cysteine ligase
VLKGKSILVGVSGSIAAYKAAELVRLLVKEEAAPRVAMTSNAQRFITPMTMQALSGRPVLMDLFDLGSESLIGHIDAAREAELVILAPATANLIAKMAAGIADDYLTTVLLATTAPVLICPAMNTKMYDHPTTQRNLETLKSFGCYILEPCEGILACKEEGRGRLADLPAIMAAADRLLTPATLRGKRVLVSAGPTQEYFDPVRFISNPSSGKMGYALAASASRRSAEVFLVTGPSSLEAPFGVETIRVTTALEMKDVVLGLAERMDVIIMAAAVGDYRPVHAAPQKIKKDSDELHISMVKNPDILAMLGGSKQQRQVLVGFAAETEHLIENATGKLLRKNLDLIVANNLARPGAGFQCDTNEVKIIDREGGISEIPCMMKNEVAERIMDRIERLLGAR